MSAACIQLRGPDTSVIDELAIAQALLDETGRHVENQTKPGKSTVGCSASLYQKPYTYSITSTFFSTTTSPQLLHSNFQQPLPVVNSLIGCEFTVLDQRSPASSANATIAGNAQIRFVPDLSHCSLPKRLCPDSLPRVAIINPVTTVHHSSRGVTVRNAPDASTPWVKTGKSGPWTTKNASQSPLGPS